MLGLALRLIALFLFLVAAIWGASFDQSQLDLMGFGFAAWVLSTLVGGYGPKSPLRKKEDE